MPKTSLWANYRRSRQKRLQKTLNMWKMGQFWKLEKWPLCKGFSLCKMVNLGPKIKLAKTYQKRLYERITDVLGKKQLQKTLNMWKMRQFWKVEKWPLCKGLCKVVILGQKIKLPKTSEKRFYKHITDVLCKKRLQRPLYAKNETILKIGKMAAMQRL